MIAYKQMPSYVQVSLDGKIVGKIKAYKDQGFRYYPKGFKSGGKIYKSVEDVKKSLIEDKSE
jgi:hypothetical protein